MSTWTDLVNKTYNENKHKRGYFLKHALKDAKKVYNSGSSDVKKVIEKKPKGKSQKRSKRKMRKTQRKK